MNKRQKNYNAKVVAVHYYLDHQAELEMDQNTGLTICGKLVFVLEDLTHMVLSSIHDAGRVDDQIFS